MDDERAALIAAMYQEEPKPGLTQRIESPVAKSRKIRVGIIEYEVPSLAYVENLERMVALQAAELARQKQMLNRLLNERSSARNAFTRQMEAMRDMRGQIDSKIGRSPE